MTQYERRAARVAQYLTDVLQKSFPEKAKSFEITHGEVTQYVNEAIGSKPIPVPLHMQPTYEFYLRPKVNHDKKSRVMILHRQDLAARISGGISNERKFYYIDLFRDQIAKQIGNLEGEISKPL